MVLALLYHAVLVTRVALDVPSIFAVFVVLVVACCSRGSVVLRNSCYSRDRYGSVGPQGFV